MAKKAKAKAKKKKTPKKKRVNQARAAAKKPAKKKATTKPKAEKKASASKPKGAVVKKTLPTDNTLTVEYLYPVALEVVASAADPVQLCAKYLVMLSEQDKKRGDLVQDFTWAIYAMDAFLLTENGKIADDARPSVEHFVCDVALFALQMMRDRKYAHLSSTAVYAPDGFKRDALIYALSRVLGYED